MRKLHKKMTLFSLMVTLFPLCFLQGCGTDENVLQSEENGSIPVALEQSPAATKQQPIAAKSTVSQTDARTYYVDVVNGRDTNDGSEENPFKTISNAAGRVGAGDTVIVMPGVYDEGVQLTRDGSPEGYITFKTHPDFMAKDLIEKYKDFDMAMNAGVLVTGGNTANGFNVLASHQWIEGFFITTPDSTHSIGIKVRRPAEATQSYYDIGIRNNVVFNCSEAGINSDGGYDLYIQGNIIIQNASSALWEGSGISIGFNSVPLDVGNTEGWRLIVENNICYNNSGYDIGRRKYLGDPNVGHTGTKGSTDGNGIIIDWARETRTLVRNNILYNNGGRGICITASSNVMVANNTLYDNAWDPYQAYHWNEYDDWWGELQRGGDGNIFINNIIFANAKNTTVRKDGSIGVRPKNQYSYQGFNLYYNGTIQADALHDGDITDQNPMFVNPPPLIGYGDRPPVGKSDNQAYEADYENANPLDIIHYFHLDFSLQEGSPAIGSGYTLASEITKPHYLIEDEVLEELKYWLENGLPKYDIFGNPRDFDRMDMGAIAFIKK